MLLKRCHTCEAAYESAALLQIGKWKFGIRVHTCNGPLVLRLYFGVWVCPITPRKDKV